MEAYDTKYPEDKSYASVTINILKNTNPPVIVPSSLTATINDYDPPGTFVVDVNATDADYTVSKSNVTRNGTCSSPFYCILIKLLTCLNVESQYEKLLHV